MDNGKRFTCKKCRKCGAATSVLATKVENARFGRLGMQYAYQNAVGDKFPLVNGWLYIPCRGCGAEVHASRVFGTFKADHKCDARCLNAKGHNCECSCGGKNHGAGYEATTMQEAANV